jgi:hypothetical protein
MKPVMQTKLGMPDGNCWVACVASILEISIDELGDLEDAYRSSLIEWEEGERTEPFQWSRVLAETHALGFTLLWIMMTDPCVPRLAPRGYSIATGPANGCGTPHSCVALDGEVVHDPDPHSRGLEVIESYDILIPVVAEDALPATTFRRATDSPQDMH